MFQTEGVANLLCSALEGGSNYWYMIENHNRKELGLDYVHEVVLHPEGEIIFSERENPEARHTLNLEKVQKGLHEFRVNHPVHYLHWVREQDDASTGDVFLQVCLFGEVIYG